MGVSQLKSTSIGELVAQRTTGILWSVTTVFALIAVGLNVIESQKDLLALEASGKNGILRVSIVGTRNEQVCIFAALIADLGASVVAMRSRPSTTLFQRWGPVYALFGTIAITGASFAKKRQRVGILQGLRLRRE